MTHGKSIRPAGHAEKSPPRKAGRPKSGGDAQKTAPLSRAQSLGSTTIESQPIAVHLQELRNRLLVVAVVGILAFAGCYYFAPFIYGFLVRPLAETMAGENRRLIYTSLTEAFFTYVRVSFFSSACITLPVILGQAWRFVAPGLYRRERRAVFPFLIATPVLFFIGAAVVYYLVFPVAWKFFLSFEGGTVSGLPIQLEARVGEYLSLVMALVFAFGLAFQLPVVLLLLARAGLISAKSLTSRRRVAILLIFVVAAILTPPDVVSQVSLALPMWLLFEGSIAMIRMQEKRHAMGIKKEP